MRKYSFLTLFISWFCYAQTPIDNVMYSNDKIYVVVAVLAIIFIGIAVYLRRLDKKITALEKKNEA